MENRNLYTYFGPMFSGKSEKLVTVYHSLSDPKAIFKPSIDTRDEVLIKSRHGEQAIAIPLKNIEEVFNYLKTPKKEMHLFFDEVFMFGGDLVETVKKLLELGYFVHIGGLDTNYLGNPFVETQILISMTPECNKHKLHGWCHICNKPSNWTVRLTNGVLDGPETPLIVVDDGRNDTIYQTRCDEHKRYNSLK